MSQSTNTTLKYIKENSSSSLMEKLKLYENENKLLRNQLKENSKITELEMSNLKEKLIKEIQQISDKELEFKIQKQTFDENYSKVVKEKTQLEKKLAAKQEDYNRIKVENDGFLIKIREMSNEIPILKRQIASLEKNRNNHVYFLFDLILFLNVILKKN